MDSWPMDGIAVALLALLSIAYRRMGWNLEIVLQLNITFCVRLRMTS